LTSNRPDEGVIRCALPEVISQRRHPNARSASYEHSKQPVWCSELSGVEDFSMIK
jgi:hypothetical protein